MKRTVNNLLGYKLQTDDGAVGRVFDLFFDDQLWQIRHLVVETGHWLSMRRVLLAPSTIRTFAGDSRELFVTLSRQEVLLSPHPNTHQPVSRQEALLLSERCSCHAPRETCTKTALINSSSRNHRRKSCEGDPHLRSFREVRKYALSDGDRSIAVVDDVVFDDGDYRIVFVVLSSNDWFDRRRFSLPAAALSHISWADRTFVTKCRLQKLDELPLFRPCSPVNSQEELVWLDYCGRPVDGTVRSRYVP